MSIEQELQDRSGSACELCGGTEGLSVFEVPPQTEASTENCLLLCRTCLSQIDGEQAIDANHWRCLGDSMWKPVPAIQVMAWRMLKRLTGNDELTAWAQEQLDMLYLDEETKSWAEEGSAGSTEDIAAVEHLDSNGNLLEAGDTVTLVKDLDVKGANFTAKRGTAVRNISLVADNPEQIEGRINGQRIVLLTRFVKKSS